MHEYKPHTKDSVGIRFRRLERNLGDGDWRFHVLIPGCVNKVHINGIRKVDWPKDRAQLYSVFPKRVLEKRRKFGRLRQGR